MKIRQMQRGGGAELPRAGKKKKPAFFSGWSEVAGKKRKFI